MRLQRLRLTNFRQHAATELEFGPGITGIIGPNGAGKTTLLEAIAWAFYGTPAVRGSRDGIRWNRAPARSPVRVEVDFGLGAHEYRVVRTLYGAELYLDRGTTPVATSANEVSFRVQRVLGMTREEFFNTYFTGQKELAVMATMGATDRGKFLSRILGYERLRLAQDVLREERSRLRATLAGLETGLGDAEGLERERVEAGERVEAAQAAVRHAEAARRDARQQREAVGPAWTELVRLRERLLALDGDRRVAEKDVTEARREFQRLDKELAEALAAQGALKELEPALADLEPLRAELDRLEAEARAAGQRRQFTGQLAERRELHARMQARRSAIGDVARLVAEAERQIARTRGALAAAEGAEERARTEWVKARENAETKREELRRQYRILQEDRQRIVDAGPDGICPTCTRPLREEYPTVLGTLERQLEEIELNGKFYAQRVEQLSREPQAVVDGRQQVGTARAAFEAAATSAAQARARAEEVAQLDAEIARVGEGIAELERQIAALPERYDADRHDVVRARLKELEPALTRRAELRVKAGRAAQLVTEAEGAERALSQREARLAELIEAIASLGFSEERYRAAREAYEVAEAAVQEAEVMLVSREGERKAADAARAAIERRIAERAERAAQADAIRAEARVHDVLDDALGDLRSDLNAQLRPELSEIASAFLADLTDGRYHELELDDQYRILVLEDGEAKPVISGGEEDIANLVLRLAISQMVAERAGQPLSLLVLDEIFGSLDEGRRQHVVALLRRLADRFPQVILITHIESVRDSVDRVLRVTVDAERGCALVAEEAGGTDEDVAA